MKYTLSLWGWELRSARRRIAHRPLPAQWCYNVCLAIRSGLTQWSLSPEGCDFDEAVFAEDQERFAKNRRAQAEEIRSKPFVMPEMPPLSPERIPEIEEYERRRYDNAFEDAERDIVAATEQMERLRHFEPGDWRMHVTQLWSVTADGFFDRVLFRPAGRGKGRKAELVISGTTYAFECDIAADRIDCRLTPLGETKPIDDESCGQDVAQAGDAEDGAGLAQA